MYILCKYTWAFEVVKPSISSLSNPLQIARELLIISITSLLKTECSHSMVGGWWCVSVVDYMYMDVRLSCLLAKEAADSFL